MTPAGMPLDIRALGVAYIAAALWFIVYGIWRAGSVAEGPFDTPWALGPIAVIVVIGLGLEGFGFCLAGLDAFLVSLLVVEPGG